MKNLSIYLMVLLTSFLLLSCGDDEDIVKADEKEEEEEEVIEKENISYYGETEMAFNYASVGDAGEEEGYHFTTLFLSDNNLGEGLNNLSNGDSFIAIFFASKSEHFEAINYSEIKSSNTSSEDSMFEGGNLRFEYDENVQEAPLNVEAGSINLIEYDFSTKTIELEYEFELEDGKTLKGYYKGDFEFIGQIG